LISKENPGEAIRLLDLARVLAPGTLVEETALRRELVLADEIADIDKFTFLSSEYIWRFPNSAYFDSFRQRFVSSAVFGLTVKPCPAALAAEPPASMSRGSEAVSERIDSSGREGIAQFQRVGAC
jgi:hypothetical protein